MSPEVAAAVRQQTACSSCGAQPGERCRTPVDGRDTGWIHDARVYANLFKPENGDS